MKAINRNLLLNILRRDGQLSRTSLTETSGLSVGAVSQIVNELIDGRWVLEAGEGAYTGGRRQTLLRLNPTAGYAIGLKLMETRIVGAVTDFNARVLHYADCPLEDGGTPIVVADAIARCVSRLIAEASLSGNQLFGVGIGIAGVIDSTAGVVTHSPFFGWRGVPFTEMVEARIGLPVSLENDVNTLTITEQLFGAGRHQDNFVVVTIGRGIGMGIVIHGQLYRGARGGAGEFGQIPLGVGDMAMETLEAQASDVAVLAAYRRAGKQAASILDVAGAATRGDAIAHALLRDSGAALGIGMATIINVLSPSLVIVSGEGVAAGNIRLSAMREALATHIFAGLAETAKVEIVPTDDQAWARGAASLVMSKVFASPLAQTSIAV